MRLAVLCLAGLALFGVLAWPLVNNQVVIDSDLGRSHLPSRDFYQKCLRAGDDFFWSPGQFCGYFIHGEGQGGFDHPLHRLLYGALPLVPAFNLEVFLSYPFLLAGAYCLLRRHALSREAALFGGLMCTFSGFTLPHYPHANAIAIVAHIPWLLLAVDHLWKTELKTALAASQLAIATLTGSQVLLGYPQYVWFSALAQALYVLVLFVERRRWSRLALLAAAQLLGLLIGAAQLLPSIEALRDSPRMGYSKQFRGMLSLHPAHLLQWLAPMAFNVEMQHHEYTTYAGGLAALALGLWLSRPAWPKDVLPRWAAWMVVLGLLLALGRYTPLFHVYLRLPVVGVFRGPCRYLVLVHMGVAVLTAAWVERLRRPDRPRSHAAIALVVLISWITSLLLYLRFDWLGPELASFHESGKVMPFVGAMILTTLAGLVALAVKGQRWALTLAMLLALLDQGFFGFRANWAYRHGSLDEYRAAEMQPPGPVNGRVEMADAYGNGINLMGWRQTTGYVGLTPPKRLDYSRDEVLRLAGTTWKYDGARWQALDGLPRVCMVASAQKSDDSGRDLAGIDPAAVVLLDALPDLPGGAPGSVEIIRDRPGLLEVATQAESRQALVFAESFHSAWRATLDGDAVDVLRAYGDFQAVIVPAGSHRVMFHFMPASVTWGRRLSWLGFALSLAAALIQSSFRSEESRTKYANGGSR